MERTCVLVKPDALQRSLLGEIMLRFERKGLKIVGCKMLRIADHVLDAHYAHHVGKPFFAGLKRFMQSAPIVAMVVEGLDVVNTVRTIVGPTNGRVAPAGTIRGDLSMSQQANLVHASDSVDAAAQEVQRFFSAEELFTYEQGNSSWVYADDERT
ncbi:MAG: nucleoside-diphosphate kinase [bacterium]|nr:nucleoside-diphosphate kinase [bacterium]